MVKEHFNSIAERYDLVNRLISLNLDRCWRRKACEEALKVLSPSEDKISVLDVACGTGDMLRCLRKKLAEKGIDAEFYGLDCSENMLEVAKKKVPFARLVHGFAEDMPFRDESFDLITVAFGVRNFSDREKAIGELYRVLKPSGVLAVLEFSRNPSFLGKTAWFYTKSVVPLIGGLVTGDEEAYAYLVRSIRRFPRPKELSKEFERAGFSTLRLRWFFPRIAFLLLLRKGR
ncbi:bifunctional demethylmenaquinone methyltransferase/2-methoxy-6-polyprenyl-1,4-benzoquinol methylase UbiE [Thermococcus sp. Bubb.Bath]|uniref:bifunctional demethylmenaquinone methyltransferase/2-methoxy-6-polyprenyl-1,4-benzoquinol methylase UbiE n=1 Tax=Thermococcus sp. Bubb.Bath TaxID=1638242 RepID=UPI00143A32D3|nr:bifunctional demethylmenaquinone methyltransferase/2-methoxy-6-polyprenyl-1,4-benzoquinol methylase UbiE [Thermococcus sp. Bubb.Bath]